MAGKLTVLLIPLLPPPLKPPAPPAAAAPSWLPEVVRGGDAEDSGGDAVFEFGWDGEAEEANGKCNLWPPKAVFDWKLAKGPEFKWGG